MSALSWFRAARRAIGLPGQPVFTNLEALLETEGRDDRVDFRILARILPIVLLVLNAGIVFAMLRRDNPAALVWALGSCAAAYGLWALLDRCDRAVSRSKVRIRALSRQLRTRYHALTHLIGVEPALSPAVASILDEASGIYLRHAGPCPPERRGLLDAPRTRALEAMEEGLARLMELSEPAAPHAQELQLGRGWAQPLLEEMRGLDRLLIELEDGSRTPLCEEADDPLARLREARAELERLDSAVVELRHGGSQ
jgi:hypothetical protein